MTFELFYGLECGLSILINASHALGDTVGPAVGDGGFYKHQSHRVGWLFKCIAFCCELVLSLIERHIKNSAIIVTFSASHFNSHQIFLCAFKAQLPGA